MNFFVCLNQKNSCPCAKFFFALIFFSTRKAMPQIIKKQKGRLALDYAAEFPVVRDIRQLKNRFGGEYQTKK